MKNLIVIVWFLLGLVLLSGQFQRTDLKQELKSDDSRLITEIIKVEETKPFFEIDKEHKRMLASIQAFSININSIDIFKHVVETKDLKLTGEGIPN